MKSTAQSKPRTDGYSKSQPKRIHLLSEIVKLDAKESQSRLKLKESICKKQFGKEWRNFVRSGRTFTRVEKIDPVTAEGEVFYVLRPEPGWEWACANCGTYSLVTESLKAHWKFSNRGVLECGVANLLAEWEDMAAKMVARGFKPPVKPIPELAGCPNCKFRPGIPE